MGRYTTDKCLITDLQASESNVLVNGYHYYIETKNNDLHIVIPPSFEHWKNENFFKDNKHIFAGALLNGKLIPKDAKPEFALTREFLIEKFKELNYPKTPKEKLDNLFITLFQKQKFEGERIDIYKEMFKPMMYYKHYFRTKDECNFYMKSLDYSGLISGTFNNPANGDNETIMKYQITYKGLTYYNDITEKGLLSKNCFIAMSFSDKLSELRTTLKDAIRETGYNPILIDEIFYASTLTINDAIIAELKKCKFCVADFTEQKDGVYFESGFAAGQNKQVIYCCREDWFKESHFDTNHFPHIIYKSEKDLKEKLINKIEAWI